MLSLGIAPAQKRSLAVEDFDYSTVMTDVQAIFGNHLNLGRGINAMMVKRISQSGRFTVVERNKVASVMREQDFAASGRVKKGTGPRTGQIRGAELTLMGDIVVFGRDDRRKSGVIGVLVPGAGGIGGGYKQTNKAVVVLAYRLVDAETSEVVAAGKVRGESKRESKGVGALLFVGGVLAGGAVDMTSSNFAQTIIGEATTDAVDKLAADLDGRSTAVTAAAREIEIDARVADASGSTLIINAGAALGVKMGDRLQVYRLGRAIKDPTTGEVLDQAADRIGEMVVTQVKEKIAIGAYTGSPAKVGDAARKN